MDVFDYLPGDKKKIYLRIPVSGSIAICKSILQIIDTKEYQRLRGVRQLGPTIFVFPGANHTRFEHSLGVYHNSVQYLNKLFSLPKFVDIVKHNEERIVRTVILSALLHDIGHFPYSHWVEEINSFNEGAELASHEDRAFGIIEESAIGGLIKKEWKLDITDITKTITNNNKKSELGGLQGLMNSILSSIIDIDKLDYLIRDSVHTGVDYGHGIDHSRLLDSLYVFESPSKREKKICITSKGKSALMSILMVRNIMYQEVYWHKTVRICDAMFKRFFYEYTHVKKITTSQLEDFTKLTDDEFTSRLFVDAEGLKNKKLLQLITPFAFKGRKLYKLLYLYQHNAEESEIDLNTFFNQVSEMAYTELVYISNKLVEELKVDMPGLTELDIIIERTPIRKGHEVDHLYRFKIWNEKKQEYENCPSQIKRLNSYLEDSVQSYILCSPSFYEKIKKKGEKGKIGINFDFLNRYMKWNHL